MQNHPLINKNLFQLRQTLHTFTCHDSYASCVYGIPITPDSQTLVSHSFEKIGIWNLLSGEIIDVLPGHSDFIFSLAISFDGETLASGSLDKTVKIWNLKTGKLLYTLSYRADPIHSVAFSLDSKILACGGSNKYKTPEGKATIIYLWDYKSGQLIGKILGHLKRVDSLAFSPDGQVIASLSCHDKTIKIHSLETLKLLYTINQHTYGSTNIAISPDSKNLISITDNSIEIWDLVTGDILNNFSDERIESIRCFAIHPNGQTLATGGNDTLGIWNLKTGKLIQTLFFQQPNIITFSPDGKMLASGSAACHDVGTSRVAIISVWQVPEELCQDKIEDNSIPETQKLAVLQDNLNSNGYFNPESIEDARERTTTSIARRQGQPKFRSDLLKAYQGRCAITGFNAEQALEAAHIYPYKGNDTNKVWNGLLLRADIHTLFDLYLITVHPETKEIHIAPELKSTSYSELHGKKLSLPKDESLSPRREVLEWHYQQCNWVEVI